MTFDIPLLKFIEMKANSAGFTSAEEFLYDFKLVSELCKTTDLTYSKFMNVFPFQIQHNSTVFNGKQHKISKFAYALYEVVLIE